MARVRRLWSGAAALLLSAACAAPPPLTVHIIAHSHCDPGWLESFEGYYQSQVGRILSNVMGELTADSARRFVWAETSFWMRWYEVQSEDMKATVKRHVDSGQLEFIGGGWVQNDEANPDPISVISQLTEGHEYLQSLFGKRPRIAWQIDPFGHSAAFAAVAASAGFDALVINRIDHTVKDALKARAALEFVWHPYATHPLLHGGAGEEGGQGVDTPFGAPVPPSPAPLNGWSYSNASIYTHVLHTHYSAPRGYDFENPEGQAVSDWNVAQRASSLVTDMRGRARAYRTPHLLVPFGDDFKFQDANRQFSNMDQLVKYVNERNGRAPGKLAEQQFDGVVIRYSTLSEYFDAVSAHLRGEGRSGAGAGDLAGAQPPVPIPVYGPSGFSDGGADFFPYADNPSSFWTGYYVSRPQLKLAIRRTAALLRGGEALVAMVRPWAQAWQGQAANVLSSLAEAVGASSKGSTAVDRLQSASVEVTPYASFSWLKAAQRLEQVRLDAALSLHHDAITGTSRDNVVQDYTRRMNEGYDDVLGVTTDVASLLLGGMHRAHVSAVPEAGEEGSARAGSQAALLLSTAASLSRGGGGAGGVVALSPAPITPIPHVLPVLESVVLTVTSSKKGDAVVHTLESSTPAHPVVLYNPSGWTRRAVVSVVVDVAGGAGAAGSDTTQGCRKTHWPFGLVTDDEGVAVPSQWTAVLEAPEASSTIRDVGTRASSGLPGWQRSGTRYELSFAVHLPPMSLSTYFATAAWTARAADGGPDAGEPQACGTTDERLHGAGARSTTLRVHVPDSPALVIEEERGGEGSPPPRVLVERTAQADTVVLENACVAVEVSRWTGLLVSVTRKHASRGAAAGVRVEVSQRYGVYETHASGAYLFRPLDDPNTGSMDQPANGPDSVTISVSQGEGKAGAGRGGLVQVARVTGGKFSQTIRVTDTAGWTTPSGVGAGVDLPALCSDALHPDASFEVLPTVHAGGNQELVMILETDIDVTAGRRGDAGRSTNTRDQGVGQGYHPEDEGGGGGADAGCGVGAGGGGDGAVPTGWWTSDGLGLLRRSPPPMDLRKDQLSRFFYPLNTLTRIAGPVVGGSTSSAPPLSAWLSVYTQSPFGVMARPVAKGDGMGTRMEIMLHRHLSQDDGRGLATGVYDTTVITPRLLFTVGAALGGVEAAPRDAVTDDVVVRVQNVGGPAVYVDVARLLAGPGVSTGGEAAGGRASGGTLATTSLRGRSLTMNGPAIVAGEGAGACGATCAALASSSRSTPAQRKRASANPYAYASFLTLLRLPGDGVRRASAIALNDAGSPHALSLAGEDEISAGLEAISKAAVGNARAEAVERQNTEEEGVFISDAALEKARAAAGGGRLLLEVEEGEEGARVGGKFARAAEAVSQARQLVKAAGVGRKSAGGKTWKRVPVFPASGVEAGVGSYPVLLPPSSIRSFFLALSPGEGGSASGMPIAVLQGVTATAHAAVGRKRRPAHEPIAALAEPEAGAEEEEGVEGQGDDARSVTATQQSALWAGLVQSVPLDEATRARLTGVLDSGAALTPQDERMLYRMARVSTRLHQQEMPEGVGGLLARIIAQRRVEAEGSDAQPAAFWSDAALEPSAEDEALASRILGNPAKGAAGRVAAGGKGRERRDPRPASGRSRQGAREGDGEKGAGKGQPLPKDLWGGGATGAQRTRDDAPGKGTQRTSGTGRGVKSRKHLILDEDSGPVELPFVTRGEDGEDISLGTLALSVVVWLLAAGGLLAALRALCTPKRTAALLPTTVGEAVEAPSGAGSAGPPPSGIVDSLFQGWKRAANPGKTH